jgi:hypothetical protein
VVTFPHCVYGSTVKAADLIGTQRPDRWGAEIGIQSGLVAKAVATPRTGELPKAELLSRAERVVRDFVRPITDNDLGIGNWIDFDLTFHWSSGHRDDARIPVEPDIALFAGRLPAEASSPWAEVNLLLCGTTRHMLCPVSPLGDAADPTRARIGSGTNWLDDVVKAVDKAQEASGEPPTWLVSTDPRPRDANDRDWVVQTVYRIVMDESPASQRTRFTGCAQVLRVADDELTGRHVLASPLYVARPQRRNARGMKRVLSYLRR